jgi:mono/diheme cytochrome c family protein
MRFIILFCFLALAACGRGATDVAKEKAGGPPPMPPYQMRAEAPPGDRTAPGRDGRALYSNLCGACHLPGGMGTNVLSAQMKASRRPMNEALLENRTDLGADYVTTVVRRGKGAMPPLSRVEVTDAELRSISVYLSSSRR